MNQHLQTILNLIQQAEHFTEEEKTALLKAAKNADKELEITAFKLERTEKVKKTTAILLEETIEELEQKRKAVEAQNRELEIEAALERMRTVAMAMSKPEDLLNISKIQFNELKQLGFTEMRNALIGIFHDDKNYFSDYDYSDFSGGSITNIPYNKNAVIDRSLKQMKSATDAFTEFIVEGNELEEWKTFRKQNGEYDDTRITNELYYYFYSIEQGNVGISTFKKISDEQLNILKKFRNVFDLAYKRYVDITNAEAHARESQIQLALERARTQSMIMQHSTELDDTLRVFHEQVLHLNIPSAFSFLWLPDEDKDRHVFWAAWAENNSFKSKAIDYPLDRNEPATALCLVDWKSNEPVVAYHVPPGGVENYFAAWSELIAGVEELKPENFSDGLYYVEAFMKYGCFGVMVRHTLPEDEKKILHRFAVEFERAYTRFLELQKAEAQARESQIQLAMERVRARTMAMQKSDELSQASNLLFQQMQSLEIPAWSAGYCIWGNPEKTSATFGMSSEGILQPPFTSPLTENSVCISYREASLRGEEFYAAEYSGEELAAMYQYLMGLADLQKMWNKFIDENIQLPTFPTCQVNHVVYFAQGFLLFVTHKHVPEVHDIFKRFGKVFEQTYTRFLDLQKAEAQARESQTEAALERVRSRGMGMQKSEELKEVIQVVYEQFVHLNIHVEHTGFIMDYKASNEMHIWLADQHAVPFQVTIPYFDSAHWNSFNEAKEKGTDFFSNHFSFEEKNRFYQDLFKLIPGVPQETLEYYFSCPGLAISTVLLENIGLYIENFSGIPYTDEENNTLMRFGKVFQQTYTRFLDLQKAEAQALEAIKRASVDRVRAEIASMRTTGDLERITPLIWNELTTLGVPFVRCGVFIMDEANQEVQTMLSTPDGKAIATLHVPFEFDLSITTNGVQYWRKKEIYKEYWDTAAFTKAWLKLSSLRGTSIDAPQVEHPPENLYLHLLPFLQGMLYVGSDAPLNEDELNLVQNLADAFSTAYARYEDFNKLEAAKKQVDSALNKLQATQKQLIQSEKMASLGELTAGIAHEIQNPLNFVNNFSEVNQELINELVEEVDRGNTEEVKAIANDIKANEEKINHHGKRADAIVKGMLQHSRKSEGKKEPTDINALCDEYLRLSYHGLRGKDKEFNAEIKTDFDETIGKINIVPQDIGRVLLNLFNNAFYAVNEKLTVHRSPLTDNYKPLVSIQTKKIDDKVEIIVSDNGNGIPQNIVDKIFQPFFTTKPTGQGTGLGLSLSYDIIKAHGGEIKMETKESKGSTFIIQIPFN